MSIHDFNQDELELYIARQELNRSTFEKNFLDHSNIRYNKYSEYCANQKEQAIALFEKKFGAYAPIH